MARSLALSAYRALARRGNLPDQPPAAPRPESELVWIHAGESGNLLAVQDLALRLCAARQGLHVLITLPEDQQAVAETSARISSTLIQTVAPSEHPTAVTAFIDHWRPDTCLWVWGGLLPNLLVEAAERHCPMFLIDADSDGFDQRRDRWLRDLNRPLLTQFHAVLTRSAAGLKRLTSLGVPKDNIVQASALLAGGQVLSCADADLDELSQAIGGRPAWFASRVTERELPIVLTAHRSALRLSHRLLLFLQPHEDVSADVLSNLAVAQDLTTVRWDDGQFPDDLTQMVISTDAADRGLFFRVASVSFLGGTLVPNGDGEDPLEAATLGSAILYGPRVGHYMPSYSRLAVAGAARIVNDAAALGTAVSRLIAPDQAAAMAHAGWDVISEGAELTDKVVDLVQDALDVGRSST